MISVGDRVRINEKYRITEGTGRVFKVVAGPQEVCGSICVWLEGYRGCCCVDGLEKVDDKDLKYLDERYEVVYRNRGYAICTLKVAVPSEGDNPGYVIDDAEFAGLVFGDPEGAIRAINEREI